MTTLSSKKAWGRSRWKQVVDMVVQADGGDLGVVLLFFRPNEVICFKQGFLKTLPQKNEPNKS